MDPGPAGGAGARAGGTATVARILIYPDAPPPLPPCCPAHARPPLPPRCRPAVPAHARTATLERTRARMHRSDRRAQPPPPDRGLHAPAAAWAASRKCLIQSGRRRSCGRVLPRAQAPPAAACPNLRPARRRPVYDVMFACLRTVGHEKTALICPSAPALGTAVRRGPCP
jgi:hypothetical protein